MGYGLCVPYLTLMIMGGLNDMTAVLVTGVALIIGYGLADLISGLVHWASDNFGQRDNAVIGPMFVIPFRDHHDDPGAITRETLLELHGINCFNLLPLLSLAIIFLEPASGSRISLFLAVTILGISLGVIAATQIHRWVHQERVPAWVELLQTAGLVISKESHAIHHCEPHDEYYCIASGWWNRVLCQTRFYRRVEALIEGLTGLRPAREEKSAS